MRNPPPAGTNVFRLPPYKRTNRCPQDPSSRKESGAIRVTLNFVSIRLSLDDVGFCNATVQQCGRPEGSSHVVRLESEQCLRELTAGRAFETTSSTRSTDDWSFLLIRQSWLKLRSLSAIDKPCLEVCLSYNVPGEHIGAIPPCLTPITFNIPLRIRQDVTKDLPLS